jgi:hypothetical protein
MEKFEAEFNEVKTIRLGVFWVKFTISLTGQKRCDIKGNIRKTYEQKTARESVEKEISALTEMAF